MPRERIRVEESADHEGIRWIWLDRPERANAFDQRMRDELESAFVEAAREPLRAVFLRGGGGRFSAGNDTAERVAEPGTGGATMRDRFDARNAWLRAVWECPCPVVAVVEGAAIGQASDLVARCDIAVCAADVRFGWPEARAGGVPMTIWPHALAHAKLVKELLITGRPFGAEEALRLGLVNRVVDPAELDEVAERLAADLAELDPVAMNGVKEMVNRRIEGASMRDAFASGVLANVLAHQSEKATAHWRDAEEGRAPTAGFSAVESGSEPYWLIGHGLDGARGGEAA